MADEMVANATAAARPHEPRHETPSKLGGKDIPVCHLNSRPRRLSLSSVMDGLAIARALSRLEQVLLGPIAQEVRDLQRQTAAAVGVTARAPLARVSG